MSKTKRSAESNYNVLKDQDIIDLEVKEIVKDDAFLVLWVPGSKLDIGIECCKSWGFDPIQTWVWVKTKQNPLDKIYSEILQLNKTISIKNAIKNVLNNFDMNDILNFFMGHSFRQTHEIAIVGGRGSYTKLLKNKSQRSVYIGPALKNHSEKPEALQDRLDIMFPNAHKLEMFARRDRPGWTCVGNKCPSTVGEDIRDTIERLNKLP